MGRLIDAITARDLEAARAALAQNPAAAVRDVSPEGTPAVCLAMYYRQPELAEAIAAAKGDLDIHEAAIMGRTARVRALLDADPSLVNARSADDAYPLGLAAYFRHPDTARLLLDRGADQNRAGMGAMKVTALHAAVSSGQTEIVRWLLDAGADVNARQQMDYTPLMGAAANARIDIIELLLARGADTSLRSTDGKTAADVAREHGHDETASRLV
jgi:uncharacterized protein